MIDNPFDLVRKNQIDLETRIEKIKEREHELGLRLPEHNERLEKLRKGYKVLGLVKDEQDEDQSPVTRDSFLKESEILSKRFDLIKRNPSSKEEMFNEQQKLEQYIADMMTLITRRWNTAVSFVELWRTERIELRQKELSLQNEYAKLSTSDSNTDQAQWMGQAENVFTQHELLIEEQKKRLYGEEEVLKELESLLEMREQLFKMAEESFRL